MVKVHVQYKETPKKLEIKKSKNKKKIKIIGYWDKDWGLKKLDEKEFYEIEKKDGNLLIKSSAHYGIQKFDEICLSPQEITLIFSGTSHAPNEIHCSKRKLKRGYKEEVLQISFLNSIL